MRLFAKSVALALLALAGSIVLFGYSGFASGLQADAPYVVGTPIPIGGHDAGSGPEGVAVDTATNRIFIANTNDNKVYVVNGETNAVMATLTDSRIGGPLGVAVDPTARRVYVTQTDLNSLLVIDADTLLIVKSISLVGPLPGDVNGVKPQDVVVWPAKQRAYVAMWASTSDPNNGAAYIYVLDTSTDTIIATPNTTYTHAYWLALDQTRNKLYVTYYLTGGGTFLGVMDTNLNVVGEVLNLDSGNAYPLANAAGVAVSPSNGYVYVAQESSTSNPRLAIFSWNGSAYGKAVSWPGLLLPVGRPVGVGYNSGTDRVFVGAYQASAVVYLNAATNSVEGTLTLPTGSGPHVGIAVNPVTSRIYVANRLGGTLTVIQDGTVGPTPTPTNSPTPTATPSPTPMPCVADAYEPDNTPAQARVIIPTFGYTQSHSFCGTSAPWETDVDWVAFSATGPVTLTMSTSGLTGGADTFLTLFGPDMVTDTTKLASDDDSGGALASRIVYPITETGTYFLRVNNVGLAVTAAKLKALGIAPQVAVPQRNYELAVTGGPPLDKFVFLPLVIRE